MNPPDRRRSDPGRTRPPLLKMTRALVTAAVRQGQTRTAVELIAKSLRSASRLPAAQQLDLAMGVAEEAVFAAKDFVAARVFATEDEPNGCV